MGKNAQRLRGTNGQYVEFRNGMLVNQTGESVQTVYSAEPITITHEELLVTVEDAVFFTAVPAPGPGKVVYPVLTTWRLDTTSGLYGNVDVGSYFCLAWGAWNQEASAYLKGNPFLDSGGGIQYAFTGGWGAADVSLGNVITNIQCEASDVENQPLVVVFSNGQNITGGHANNNLIVQVDYMTKDLL